MATITAEDFEAATGRAPEYDDLDRVNCPKAGQTCHRQCGWDAEANLPVFMTGIPTPARGQLPPGRMEQVQLLSQGSATRGALIHVVMTCFKDVPGGSAVGSEITVKEAMHIVDNLPYTFPASNEPGRCHAIHTHLKNSGAEVTILRRYSSQQAAEK